MVQLDLGDAHLELRRHPGAGGALLLVRTAHLQECLENGHRSTALSRVIAGVAHDIKNPLNAMALQLAILSEKLSGEGEAAGAAVPHLSALREQIGRVNEVVRRFLDVTDPLRASRVRRAGCAARRPDGALRTRGAPPPHPPCRGGAARGGAGRG